MSSPSTPWSSLLTHLQSHPVSPAHLPDPNPCRWQQRLQTPSSRHMAYCFGVTCSREQVQSLKSRLQEPVTRPTAWQEDSQKLNKENKQELGFHFESLARLDWGAGEDSMRDMVVQLLLLCCFLLFLCSCRVLSQFFFNYIKKLLRKKTWWQVQVVHQVAHNRVFHQVLGRIIFVPFWI